MYNFLVQYYKKVPQKLRLWTIEAENPGEPECVVECGSGGGGGEGVGGVLSEKLGGGVWPTF